MKKEGTETKLMDHPLSRKTEATEDDYEISIRTVDSTKTKVFSQYEGLTGKWAGDNKVKSRRTSQMS